MPHLQSSPSITPFKILNYDADTQPLHPGEVLREDFLPHVRLSPERLAEKLGVSCAIVHNLLDERIRVTADLAQRLGAAFDVSARFWHALQLQYDLWHAQAPTSVSNEPSHDLTAPRQIRAV
jgi:addiction module HigA family antidote